ncbi:PD-(D/E)XK nuclease superfamily protein [Kordia periserrulae]|uniref:PD-(D/E)XK nuclease superfamily protein n=1 Tax=Kordia periserrulae TaxID=701523 RepID=A0A2T6BWZ6_9FLAO|nr:PD-(D/E)XK nuclease family protein [Kordia periserrulae]PTX60583.1 PD-(D/E)XK nuclease superfamily protein [Kordia periserrulae]
MKSFLSHVVEYILTTNTNISNLTLVLPSKRAGVFLKHELSQQIQQTSFAPDILSIEELVEQISGYTSVSNTELLFEFYSIYKELTPKNAQEPFDSFSKWAQILLQDFNEIDRYLINHKEIFNYLSAIQRIQQWSPDKEPSDLMTNYLKFWDKLEQYYDALTDKITQKGIAYQGLVYREAVDSLEFYLQKNEDKKHYFIGFNALNTAEEKIIQEFLEVGLAEILWDTDHIFFDDPEHDASLFLRRHRYEWNYFQKHEFSWIADNFSSEKNIEIIGVPKNITQAKYIGEILQKLQQEDETLQDVAVVLGDEQLLIPCLNSLPSAIERLNITMGFPLKDIPLATTFNNLYLLQEHHRNDTFYYKNIINVLSDTNLRPLFQQKDQNIAANIIEYIQANNIIYVATEVIVERFPKETQEIAQLLFTYWNDKPKTAIQNCVTLIRHLKATLIEEREQHLLALEYLYRFNEVFNQLQLLTKQHNYITDIKSLLALYKEIISTETLDFKGEPLQGLQLMGMLETRVLDFKTVILSSVNEGILPSGKSNNSFIPFDLKKQFKLPTYKEKDAIYTYHFYRLLHRAEHVFLLYNTEAEGLSGGERSRFLMQLETYALPNHTVTQHVVTPKVPKIEHAMQVVKKETSVMERLKDIANKGFSPSALTSYIRNPIDFYYQKILGINEYEAVEETVAANTLGTVVHDTLELLYKPFEGQIITTKDIKAMFSKVEELVIKNFKKTYGEGTIHRGKNLIIFNVAKRYVTNFLQQELQTLKSGKTLRILQIEQNLQAKVEIPELDFPVYIGGKVDRVDELDGVLRIIDYKTGKVSQSDVEIVDWDLLTQDYKFSKSFQVLAYAYMIYQQQGFSGDTEAGIISFKNLQSGFLKFGTKESSRARNKNQLVTAETLDGFLVELKQLILEICNIDIPFTEKEV